MNVENIVVDIEINNSLAPDIEQSIVATIDNNINVIKDNTDDLDVTINRKEYVITGDEIYIPKRYEDAPTWLQNMIDQVVEYSIGAKVSDMNQVVYSLNQMIEAMEVSKNTYEMSVISSNDIDTRINTAITTLNSNMNEADATILSVANTKTTPEEAEAIMINAVRAELESTEAGTIGAAVATLSTAIANEEEARSTSVETLYSTMEGEFEATATAFNTINTYIGIDEAGASTGTGLSAYIEGDDGTFGSAGSELNNQVVATAEKVESKFSYNSTVKINGVPYTSGFGLATSQIAGSGVPEGDSEFWVTADKFKLRAASQTAASQQPFTVDAVTGDIKFIGTVDFASVEGIDAGVTGILDTNNDDFAIRLGYDDYAELVSSSTAGNTIVKGGYVNTELIEAGKINAGHIDAYAISGKTITGGTINGTEINGTTINGSTINGARINGAVIKASYLDLDGELEVLTNYHISVAMYNSNPGLYFDAVYLASDNEYRIPSMSFIKETSQAGGYNQNLYGVMRSYNNANSGHNLKAVQVRPTFQNLSGVNIANSRNSVVIAIGGLTLGTMYTSGSNPSSNGYFADFVFTSPYTTGFNFRQFVGDSSSPTPEELFRTERYVYNVPVFCDLRIECVIYGSGGENGLDHSGEFKIYLAGGSHTLPFDWTSGAISIHPSGGTARLSGIQINNMV